MDALRQPRWVEDGAARSRSTELANQLRAAAMDGDDSRVRHLLAELLRLSGLPRGRRVALQLPALVSLVHSLRCVAMSDELTGLYNRRGFMQIGMRFLDVSRRDLRPAHLVYFDLNNLKQVNDSAGHASGDILIRQTGNLLRDLFPSYGVHEVIGRLGGDEFAALTTNAEYAARSAVAARARRRLQPGSSTLPPLSLSVGVAHFDPQHPVTIDELLEAAEQDMYEHKRVSRIAPSSGLTPHPV
ncbi:MAG TPA: GGDEF domain-containing protein [Steroidobacteraceae bacterium]|nr:GGDEF domain-containing protein [Steroidobacteraceae bacterium]